MTLPFKSILCGVEGNESSTEAARQAIALAAAGADLQFVAVYTSFELGPDYDREALQKGLEEAVALAGEAGVTASMELAEGRYAVDVLLSAAEKHDLLVLGTHGKSRAAGIMLGSTTSEAAHNTNRPLLIARQRANGGFPGKILVASDGSPESWAPLRVAARLAAAFDSEFELLHAVDGKHPDGPAEIESQLADVQELIGARPRLSQPEGDARSEILEEAMTGGASLIVCGRRGLRGIKSLGSVSERLVSQAESSVLLVPPDGGA